MENLLELQVQDLLNELGSNVKSIKFDTEFEEWIVDYKNGLNPDVLKSENLLEFLRNA